MKNVVIAVAAVLMCTVSAMADLTGTNMNITITHDQWTLLSTVDNVSYTYGDTSQYSVPNWGSVTIDSPAAAPGKEHALNVDFTDFAYSAFIAPFVANGTIIIHNLAEEFDLSSVEILVNGMDVATSTAVNGNGFQATWSAPMVFNGNPVQPNMTVAWNSVPAPGALALLGLAGVVAAGRRRKA